jgi:hypothetical protein
MTDLSTDPVNNPADNPGPIHATAINPQVDCSVVKENPMIDLNQLKTAAINAGGTDWKWWDSNSFRRLSFEKGQHTRDGDALSGCIQSSDGHPDVLMAPGVREFIELASPANVLALIDRLAPKCDGNHGGPRCADPECWNDSPEPATQEPVATLHDDGHYTYKGPKP